MLSSSNGLEIGFSRKQEATIFQSINEPEIGVRSCYRMVKNIKNYY
jgi:hypothetical protein